MNRIHSPIRRRTPRCGLSLIEVVVSTLLIGFLTVASLKAVGAVYRTRNAADGSHDGMQLARDLMTEILSVRYEEPDETPLFGLESGEVAGNRSSYDDLDDYDNWSSSPPEDKSNAALSGYSGWTRTISVDLVVRNTPEVTTATDEGLKRILVTVTDASGDQTQLIAWRSKWGAGEQSPTVDSTIQTWVGSELQIGSGPVQYSGANLTNHAQDQ